MFTTGKRYSRPPIVYTSRRSGRRRPLVRFSIFRPISVHVRYQLPSFRIRPYAFGVRIITIGCRRSSVVEREHKTSETCRPLPRTRTASIKYDRTTIAFLSPSVGFAFKRAHSPAHEHGPRTSVRDFYVLIDGFTTNVAPSPPTPEVVESSPPKISLSGRNFNVTGGPGTPRSLLLFTITPRARPIARVSVRERPLNYYTRSSPNVRRAVDVTTSALYVPFLTPSVNVVGNLRPFRTPDGTFRKRWRPGVRSVPFRFHCGRGSFFSPNRDG